MVVAAAAAAFRLGRNRPLVVDAKSKLEWDTNYGHRDVPPHSLLAKTSGEKVEVKIKKNNKKGL